MENAYESLMLISVICFWDSYGALFQNSVKFLLLFPIQFFRRFHAAYVDAVSNPFHVPGKKITSRSFAVRLSAIVKSFESGSNAWTFLFRSCDRHHIATVSAKLFSSQVLEVLVPCIPFACPKFLKPSSLNMLIIVYSPRYHSWSLRFLRYLKL